ncbi:hypothetical protein [Rhizobium sp. Root482]|uniref:hypothetical protein n=1 Tax=Rhizobium sp. Root482 TaxID=1736543 RepID=UPI0006F52865|nr:hypothetical protein [Rhizobium sp. Root482]KQY13419.1 hypothetical protein ASD31_13275 [Rhizobium sp. Root482]
MTDRGPTVINTGRGSGAGWAVAAVLAIVVIGALLIFGGVIDLGGNSGSTNVDVNVPAADAPAAQAPATDAPATTTAPAN